MSADRTAAVADELEIRNVLARLAQLADSGGVDEYLALLTDDVVWTMPASPAVGLPASERRGHDEIAAGIDDRRAAGLQGPGSATMHVVTTVSVVADGTDSATARSSFLYWGDTTTAPAVRSMGRYEDAFRRTDGGWKLARRIITLG